jgi:transcriptional regulator with XRE-family HTH domain
MTSRIKGARKERGWSQTRLIAELAKIADRRGVTLPSRETMKARVSRWENGHSKPDEFYRQLLREAFGMDDRELGFAALVDEPIASAADELLVRLSLQSEADGDLITSLRAQTESIRLQDRQYGAGLLLEIMRGLVANIENHLSLTVFDAARRPLANALADASSLAGWQALDVGGTDQAWRFFETASAAARQADDEDLYAFARLEQAHVLIELDRPESAADLAQSVWDESHAGVAPSVRCWMAAATAEMQGAAGRASAARAMIGRAEADVDALAGERPSYLVFNGTHLNRWIGHTLVQLEDAAAEGRLRQAAAEMDQSFTRASASLNLDLATALLLRGERHEAGELLQRAEQLARKAGSRRQLARLRKLRTGS